MATKDSILDKIDTELAELEENTPFAKRDQEYFNNLNIKTAFRNTLYNIQLSDRMAGLLDEKDNILHSILDYWSKHDFESLGLDRDDFYEIINTYLEELDYEDRDKQLYERASAEYAEFIKDLEQKTPQEIMDAAYEIVLKADILCLLESHDMDKKEINVLLTLEKPLDNIYSKWMDSDHSHMDILQQTMDDLIDEQEHNLACHQYNYEGKIPGIMQDYYAEYDGVDSGEAEDEEAGDEAESR